MSGSSSSSPFERILGSGGGQGVLARAVDLLRNPSPEQPAGGRPERSGVRDAVLVVLAEEPMDGYRIVRALEERSDGAWSPGAGAVYPALQLLADAGLAEPAATEDGGRRTWSLTPSGFIAAEAARERETGSQSPAAPTTAKRGALPRSAAQLVQTAVLVGQTGSAEQVAEAVAVLDEARRRLISILARN
jgi:DNA-binding PadR family transcriptional regulator